MRLGTEGRPLSCAQAGPRRGVAATFLFPYVYACVHMYTDESVHKVLLYTFIEQLSTLQVPHTAAC